MTTSTNDQAGAASVMPDEATRARVKRWRYAKDGASRWLVGFGGVSVIGALALMFLYLFSEVMPMLAPPEMEPLTEYAAPGEAGERTLFIAVERYQEVGFRVTDAGALYFFRPDSGEVLQRITLHIPDGVEIVSHAFGEPRTRLNILGLSDGTALLFRDAYSLIYPEGVRMVEPSVEFPLGEEPIRVDDDGAPLSVIGAQQGARGFNIAGYTADGRLLLTNVDARRNFLTGEVTLTRRGGVMERPDYAPVALLLSADLRDLFVGDDEGRLHHYNTLNVTAPERTQTVRVVSEGTGIGALSWLLGTVSVIVGGEDGSVSQWFMVRDEDNIRHLTLIREFQRMPAAVTAITPEYARKGFATADADGNIALHHSTSHRSLLQRQVSDQPVRFAINAPRNNGFLTVDETEIVRYFSLRNPHPEASIQALWSRVWYEGRQQPDFVWQSSSATDEFEPKFSLVPLTLGTIKAAFYAMLFAMPLAILGAIYSAYFMTPRMRGITKPAIEIMEALPTVILGFLAGLWFAPFVERSLPAVFSVLLLMPVMIMGLSLAWFMLPKHWRGRVVPAGWEAAALIPFILLFGWICVEMNPVLQIAFFEGDMRQWLTDRGVTYDQRNAMIVGVAMGFAVIPTIYSIAEEAIFNVPKHLTQGSLALGATTWQTVTRVVLLTASPGIFSAIMIGFGRAVGETMIVLMATGNSPVVNFNMFEGMRTLSANIAVEMPEAEAGGTHYRILFLAGLVLFVMTFALNTVAEMVRQRLRKKYASL
ncbi:MAG: ABC transporter permease subunit [Maricaulaceae bacterium]|nr:ABC transporter permease subunit [Maricaulaceae bacterium]